MAGSARKPLICRDSCVFLAWFNKEEDKPLTEIELTLRRIADQKVNLLVSVISYTEILDTAGRTTAGTMFRTYVQRPNVIVANADTRVADLAGDIRLASHKALEQKLIAQGVKIPDALIAATAVIYQADELQTFDPILLQMNGWPELKRLPILRPDDAARTPLGF